MTLLKIKRQPEVAQVEQGPDLENEIQVLRHMKEIMETAKEAFEGQQHYVLGLMGDQKTAKAGNYKATVVRRTLTKYNEAGLKKSLGAVAFRKICKQVLDTKLLEQAVTSGEIDISVVAAHAEVSEAKPYIRISTITEDES